MRVSWKEARAGRRPCLPFPKHLSLRGLSVIRRSLKEPPPEEQPFPVRGYVIINLLFYVFLLLVYWTAWFLQRGEVAGLIPVLGGLAVLFTAVSIYDASFDRVIYARHLREKEETRAREMEFRGDTPSGLPASPESASAGRRSSTE